LNPDPAKSFGSLQGWQKPGFKKNQPGWVVLGFIGFIGFFGFYWVFWVLALLNPFFLPVFVIFNYILVDEFKINK
jgi:hypothetical protein